MSLEIKRKKADIYVENNETPEDMFKKVLSKLNKFLHPKKK
jgi:dephospho-CoA kinase